MELLKNEELQVFIFSKKRPEKKASDYKLRFHNQFGDVMLIVNQLMEKEFLNCQDKVYSISEKGKAYLDEYNSIGNEFLFENKFDIAVIEFLYGIDGLFPYEFFPENILNQTKTFGKGIGKEYDLEDYLNYKSAFKPYFFANGRSILLNKEGRLYFENLLKLKEKEKENHDKEKERSSLSFENLQKENRKLTLELSDYKSIKYQNIAALIISVIAVVIAAISLFKQYF